MIGNDGNMEEIDFNVSYNLDPNNEEDLVKMQLIIIVQEKFMNKYKMN